MKLNKIPKKCINISLCIYISLINVRIFHNYLIIVVIFIVILVNRSRKLEILKATPHVQFSEHYNVSSGAKKKHGFFIVFFWNGRLMERNGIKEA